MSLGNTIGKGIGRAAATVVHAGHVAAMTSGQFGADVASGTKLSYGEHSTRLAQLRAEYKVPSRKIAITTKRSTKVAA